MTAGNVPNQPLGAAPGEAKVDLGPLISSAWNLVKADLVLFIVGYLIVAIIAGIPVVGLIVGGPLMFGFVRVIQKRYKGEPAAIGDIFKGFEDFSKGLVTMLLLFVVGLVAAIVVGIVIVIVSFIPCIGTIIAVVLYVAVLLGLGGALYFVFSIAALSPVQPIDAIKQSLTFFTANLGQMILLALVTWLIGAAGMIACGVGMFLTMPLAMAMCVIAYNEYYLPNAKNAA